MANRTIDVSESSAPAFLSRIGQGRQVVIPKRVFDALRLRGGDFMEIATDQGRVSMKPKKLSKDAEKDLGALPRRIQDRVAP